MAPSENADVNEGLTSPRSHRPGFIMAVENAWHMSRRAVIAALTTGVATIGAPAVLRRRFGCLRIPPRSTPSGRSGSFRDTVVVDLLNQFRFADNAQRPPLSERWLRQPGAFTAANWEEYKTSGFRVFGLGGGDSAYEGALTEIAEWNGFVAAYPDWFMRVSSGGDFERLASNGKIGILINMQNADHFRTVDDVDLFWGLGQRASQLTYNRTNRLGSGFLADTDGGLTEYGGQVLARMQQVGMAVDLAHAGDRTTLDALDAAKKNRHRVTRRMSRRRAGTSPRQDG
jgi:membrane dipeptidase